MARARTVGLLLVAGLAVAGWAAVSRSTAAPASDPAPIPTAGRTTSPGTTATSPGPSPGGRLRATLAQTTAGSDGLTVRYATTDGGTGTLRVEDFRR